jgi:hypothetical protein
MTIQETPQVRRRITLTTKFSLEKIPENLGRSKDLAELEFLTHSNQASATSSKELQFQQKQETKKEWMRNWKIQTG